MKYLLAFAAIFLSSCSNSSSESTNNNVPITEEQYVLPMNFKGYLNHKSLDIGVLDQWGGCLPAGCTLGGIGKDTIVRYNGDWCYFDTTLVQNHRTNYYWLQIDYRVEDIPNYNYQPNSPQCSELLGQYWIRHDGNDNENLLLHNKQFPQPNNANFEKIP